MLLVQPEKGSTAARTAPNSIDFSYTGSAGSTGSAGTAVGYTINDTSSTGTVDRAADLTSSAGKTGKTETTLLSSYLLLYFSEKENYLNRCS